MRSNLCIALFFALLPLLAKGGDHAQQPILETNAEGVEGVATAATIQRLSQCRGDCSTGTSASLGAAVSAFCGVVLIFLGFPVIYYNEKHQVQVERIFTYAKQIVKRDITTERVDFQYEGNLVHVIGETSTEETLEDDVFDITVDNCAKLSREVKMWQWVENVKEARSNSHESTFEYTQGWSDVWQNSGNFQQEKGHENPQMPFYSGCIAASCNLGAFLLSDTLIGQMVKFQDLTQDELQGFKSDAGGRSDWRLDSTGSIVTYAQGASPQIGDVMVRFRKVEVGPATVLSIQHDDSFVGLTWDMVPPATLGTCFKPVSKTHDVGTASRPLLGRITFTKLPKPKRVTGITSLVQSIFSVREELDELREQTLSADQMISKARDPQTVKYLAILASGFLLLLAGFFLLLAPGGALLRSGRLQRYAQTFREALPAVAATLWFAVTMAYAWLALKPLKAICFLFLGIFLLVLPLVA